VPAGIWSQQIRISLERCELDTNAGVKIGRLATVFLAVRKRFARLLRSMGLGSRSYSPTALQNYAKCPYRFFLHAVQGLAAREIPEAIDQLDPLQRGSLIHDIQFQLFSRLRQDGLIPVRPANLHLAQGRLDEIIAQVAVRYRDDLAPAIDRVWQDGVAAIRADLREWLRRTCEDDSGFAPWRFEMSFGLEHRSDQRQADPQSVLNAVDLDCGIRLRGSIDLVERNPSGTARVTDHKTGNADASRGQLIAGGQFAATLALRARGRKTFDRPRQSRIRATLFLHVGGASRSTKSHSTRERASRPAKLLARSAKRSLVRSFQPRQARAMRALRFFALFAALRGAQGGEETAGKSAKLMALRELP